MTVPTPQEADREPAHGSDLAVLVGPPSRLVVISPHLDDAVLSCGDLLGAHQGAVVVTAFGGRPDGYPPRTSWDERAGFEPGADVVGVRRGEDERALAMLGARPYWLDFPDPQYGSKPSRSLLAEALAAALRDLAPDIVMMPLGLFHDDHTLTSDATRDVLGCWSQPPFPCWLVYADGIYRAIPDLVEQRLQTLCDAGCTLGELHAGGEPASDRKRRAVACYASQVRALERSWEGGISDAFEPERYWQIVRPVVAGAERAASVSEERHGNRR